MMIWLYVLFLSSLSIVLQQQEAPTLDSVLKKMDAAACQLLKLRKPICVWEQYQKVVDETDSQRGTVYYRRDGQRNRNDGRH